MCDFQPTPPSGVLEKFNIVHLPSNYITYIILNTNFLQNFLFVNYCSDMFEPQLLAIVKEFTRFSTCAAYASTYVAEMLICMIKIIIKIKILRSLKSVYG
jgi:hypothetical protein